ncbi:MAG: hypothetical protein GXX84_04475 [Acidobacteria bacterium]|nr:hypothetical protein [Acidobacteriota bacterium]
MRMKSESGIALISALLVLILLGVLLEGFIVSVNSDQELLSIDRDQNRAFYGAMAGLEQLTADLGTLYDRNYAPTVTQINALTTNPPELPYISFVSPGGGSGYQIHYDADASGKPKSEQRAIPSGPYEGLVGLMTPFEMTVTARTPTGSEVRMRRSLQTVLVPVFQFGIFSDTDLSFFAGPEFDFGGRVHTNGNLFLAEGDGKTLWMRDRVTAVGEVVRTHLNNNWPTNKTYNGNVSISDSTGNFKNLKRDQGSLVGNLGSSQNPHWENISKSTYNGNIRNWRTGARRMDLPLVTMGATPIDLIRRPASGSNEDTANPEVYDQRYYAMASLRILLSDTKADILDLPGVTSTDPIHLANPWSLTWEEIGEAADTSSFKSQEGTNLIDGYIKIEMQDKSRNWHDVTEEILGFGISGKDLTNKCTSFFPNSIIRVQRLKDGISSGRCDEDSDEHDFWPNVLYDTREGILRDNISKTDYKPYLGGIMHYVELDIENLCRWFRGELGTSGPNAIDETGYVVYFSDRRTNRNDSDEETGEYGFEDFVNPGDISNGLPNGILDQGEDVNGSGAQEDYGKTPRLPAGAETPLNGSAKPWFNRVSSQNVTREIARLNRPIFFRRALKLVNGATIDLGVDTDNIPLGLAIASENPVYVQGNYNAQDGFDHGTHVAASILADAVTFLSKNWDDRNSFNCPHSLDSTCDGGKPGRAATTTWYRMAIIAGKSLPFQNIDMADSGKKDFGTDGGVHNFLRYLENWGGAKLNYRGSIVSLFYSRQATGTYKCCTNVYSPPERGYAFDVEFLDPRLLPPRTPRFRDVNITGFIQVKSPKQ